MPYHSRVISEIMARQWWSGQNPEALRWENAERFDLTKGLSSNMIALVCSAVSTSQTSVDGTNNASGSCRL